MMISNNSSVYSGQDQSRNKLMAGAGLAVAGAALAYCAARRGTITPSVLHTARRVFRGMDNVSDIKGCHSIQLNKFRRWANAGKWGKFDRAHYDWWMFPVEKPSFSYGNRFAIKPDEAVELRKDPQFMEEYREGAELVAESWGWDLKNSKQLVMDNCSGCGWTGRSVRLGKMVDSARLLGEEEIIQSMRKFAMQDHVEESLEPWTKKTLKIGVWK